MEPATRQLDLWDTPSGSSPRVNPPASNEVPDALRLELMADPSRCLTVARQRDGTVFAPVTWDRVRSIRVGHL